MRFDVKERLLLLKAVTGMQGNLTTLRLVRDLEAELSFSEDDHKKIHMRQEGTGIFWDENTVLEKEVSIGPAALDAVLSVFSNMDGTQTLTLEYLPLYERLLNEKELRVLKAQKKPQKLAAV